ncbi:F-box/kelch-repeat protein At1g16250-like [Rutidosis leptorrhynchoides]|uniref:F-box/kelch-repeat protein At1g16250-like n=1 Tax=Rutidosis leptorrhynchoides TaxID=125765 RepID=UPI003A9A5332
MSSLTSPSSPTSPTTEKFPRTSSVAIQTPSEKSEPRYGIYAIFSYKENINDTNVSCVMGCYDPSINTWSHECLVPNLGENHILKGFAMVSVGSSIYIVGGSVYKKVKVNENNVKLIDHGLGVQSQVSRYNVLTKEWFNCAPLITPRYDFACSVCDNKIYVAGGQSTSDRAMSVLSSAEVYDLSLNDWTPLPNMSTERYKCVGVTYQKKFHVIGGFTYSVNQMPFMDRCSAEVYDVKKGRWDHVRGMWQLDIPPNQIVVIDDELISSGDCLNVWKGQIETYDRDLHLWYPIEGSRKKNLLSFSCPNEGGSSESSLERICLTMAPIGTYLYFMAGYRLPGNQSSCCTISMVHRFDTSATNNRWETFEPMQVEGERELCSHACVVQLP